VDRKGAYRTARREAAPQRTVGTLSPGGYVPFHNGRVIGGTRELRHNTGDQRYYEAEAYG